MIKQPKTPKPKKCGWSKCGKMFTPSPFAFNQKTCFNTMCALGYVKDKEEKKAQKQLNEVVKQMAIKVTDWRKKVETECQLIARLIDRNLVCPSGRYQMGRIDGGHVYSKGSNKTMSMNLHNIHRQSSQANRNHNEDGIFREGIIKEYGRDYYNFITLLKHIPALNHKNEDYRLFFGKAKIISNRLKNENRSYSLEERIQLRNAVNLELGIYHPEYCEVKLNS